MKKYIPIFLIIVFSASVWFSGVYQYFSFDSLREHYEMFDAFLKQHPVISILIYSVLYILIVTLSIPGATFMSVTSGILFGQWFGTVTTVISATIGAFLLFVSLRMASQDWLTKKAEKWALKMKNGFQDNAFFYLLTLRLIPLFPFFAVNIVCALLQIPLRTFFFGTLLGIIPGSFVYVSLGVALRDVIQAKSFTPNVILSPKVIVALVGLGILALLPVLYKYFHKKNTHR